MNSQPSGEPLVRVRDLHVHFSIRGQSRRETLHALNGVNLDVEPGESLGIVGESGCGKSTLAKTMIGLVPPTSGTVEVAGSPVTSRGDRAARRRVQMVFQDPSTSLNPRMKVGTVLDELLRVHGLHTADRKRRCAELTSLVGLPSTVLDLLPSRLSGGQRQRVGIARALAVEPDVLIADEAVSALDVSVQAVVLNLLSDLREQLGLTMVFITHDLAVARTVCDRVGVMYQGRIVEIAPTEALFTSPTDPYTRALLAAAPRLNRSEVPDDPLRVPEPQVRVAPLDSPVG